MNPAVMTANLTKTFTSTTAVDGINLRIPQGVCCGFLGKNGAGKTTTMKMLTGLLPPTKGSISIMGEERAYGQSGTPNFGYLPDVPNFYGYMNGIEYLDLVGKLCKYDEKSRKERNKELMEVVGLKRTRAKIAGYSRGMKQRLGIAQAIYNNPDVIFMDEPISALDPIGRRDVANIVRSLKSTTVMLSTHIIADVEDICDYVLIIDNGKILAQDYLQNLKDSRIAGVAKIVFYNTEDLVKFKTEAENVGFTTENERDLILKIEKDINKTNLSKEITAILHTSSISCESFGVHAPTLEDIFLELTR